MSFMDIVWNRKAIEMLVRIGFIKRNIKRYRKSIFHNFVNFLNKSENIFKSRKIKRVKIFALTDSPKLSKKLKVKSAVEWIKQWISKFEGVSIEYLVIDDDEKILIILGGDKNEFQIIFLK